MKLANKKYNDLNPIIAKILEVYNIKGSFEIANIAGIESTAKSKSVNSITAILLLPYLFLLIYQYYFPSHLFLLLQRFHS